MDTHDSGRYCHTEGCRYVVALPWKSCLNFVCIRLLSFNCVFLSALPPTVHGGWLWRRRMCLNNLPLTGLKMFEATPIMCDGV